MRCLVLILLLGGAFAEDSALHDERLWLGQIDVSSTLRNGYTTEEGTEEQSERIEFRLLTRPPRQSVITAQLPFRLVETKGSYRLKIDLRRGATGVVEKGVGSGVLHARMSGHYQPRTGRYRLDIRVRPDFVKAKTTLSGQDHGEFKTWRTIATRRAFLREMTLAGRGQRILAGKRSFLDKSSGLPRDVTVTWRIERIDPVIRGVVTDHHGRPLAGLNVVATRTTPLRVRKHLPPFRREATTGADGRFEVGVFWGHWTLDVRGATPRGLVIAGARLPEGVWAKREVPIDLDVELNVYRLAELPYWRKLHRHFRGDQRAYLDYIRARFDQRILDRALTPPGEGQVPAEAARESG